MDHVSNNQKYYSRDEIPYSVEELIEQADRSRRAILGSVHRLEKRGEVKEVHGGWQRKEK